MITPKGELLKIERGKPEEFFDVVENGYLKISWKDDEDVYSACVVFKDGVAVFADLECVKSRRVLRGKNALSKIVTVDYSVVEIYRLTKKDISLIALMNDEGIAVEKIEEVKEEVEEKPEEVQEEKEERKDMDESKKVKSVEDFVYGLEDFTGMVIAKGDGIEAILYVKDGVILGAKVSLDGEEYLGLSALYYLDFEGEVTCKGLEDVERFVDDEIKIGKIAMDKDDILKKYNIPKPNEREIETLLRLLDEVTVTEEKKKIFKKLSNFLKGFKKT